MLRVHIHCTVTCRLCSRYVKHKNLILFVDIGRPWPYPMDAKVSDQCVPSVLPPSRQIQSRQKRLRRAQAILSLYSKTTLSFNYRQ